MSKVIGYNGLCPICGSGDGMIQEGYDGKIRNVCRFMGCPAMYKPAPFEGYNDVKFAIDPFSSELLSKGDCTVEKYLYGEKNEETKLEDEKRQDT